MLNHDTQEEAALEVAQFWPLLEVNCSTDLKALQFDITATFQNTGSLYTRA